MKMPTRLAPWCQFAAASISICLLTAGARGTVVTGPGGQGVPAGQSSLIGVPDYSDEFTQTAQGGPPNRPSTAVNRPSTVDFRYAIASSKACPISATGALFSCACRNISRAGANVEQAAR